MILGGEFVNKFIFDVDGTLTRQQEEIDTDFAVFFTILLVQMMFTLVTEVTKKNN